MSKFTSFLHTLSQIAPLILGIVPGIPPAVAAVVAKSMVAAEAVTQSGSDKKAAVMSVVPSIPGITPDMIAAVDKGIDTTIAVTKVIHAAHSNQK